MMSANDDTPHALSWPEIGNEPFRFRCHQGVSCFLSCCHKVEVRLFPFDVLCLKNSLSLHSADFLERYTYLGTGVHPFFPAVMLTMEDKGDSPCPFLSDAGCSVYMNRPSACRTYPLERAVEHADGQETLRDHYYLTQHDYCKGHFENHLYTVRQWEREQGLTEYNMFNELWAEVDILFASNPWQGEGKAGPLQQLAFMVCYNIDTFRAYVEQQGLLVSVRLDKDQRRRIERDDSALLRFGFEWLTCVLRNSGRF